MKRKLIAVLTTAVLAVTLSMTVCAADSDFFPSLDTEYYQSETPTTEEPETPPGSEAFSETEATEATESTETTETSVTTTTGTTVTTQVVNVRSDVSPKTGEGMGVFYIGAAGIALAGLAYSAKKRLYETDDVVA